ncbi:HNH endonuclease signature motif containing protein [Corynebacterium guangdongense]|uniref:HNH nuclease domain-containing protein n=1 Tax=Corynebacterium guangdongense TaxID=1783348 RepID=A0ABU2A0Z4_9CORY|nr:HNH endonuclease signature motif containing protein [Corynebacterium guangdongense]MDR7330857.1 hypothetical protein [Corynebacterium guangdongense]
MTQIDDALSGLAEVMATPDAVAFSSEREHFERLEKALARKPAIDAAFAYLADLHQAGRLVGGVTTADYLAGRLDISRSEASRRLRRGNELFAPPPEPPRQQPGGDESAEKRAAREAEEARRATAAAEARERARRRQSVTEEKRRIIDAELRQVTEHAQPGVDELRDLALAASASRSPEDLRRWLRDQIRSANSRRRTPGGGRDPQAAHKKRYFAFGKQDELGGVPFYGYLSAGEAALLKSRFSAKEMDAVAGPRDPEDKRTLGQQRADHLVNLVANAPASAARQRSGMGSLVISMTLDDILGMNPESVFPTNTDIYLNPADLHRLGAAISDFFVLHDRQGKPLSVGVGQRSATLEQRIALFAGELVCTHYGCGKPLDESDAHHIIAHSEGGPTHPDNLTLSCWIHHPANNDRRDGANNMGHAERDPTSGRAGWRDAGSDHLRFNDGAAAAHAAGAKIRRKYRATSDPPAGHDDPGLFAV